MLRTLGRNNVLMMVSLFIWALGEGLWVNLRQLYLADLGASPTQIGTALAVEAISKAAILIPAGYVADRIGPYRVVILSWLLGIAGPVLMAPAQSWQWAVPGMVVYALSGFAIPSVSAFALLSIPDKSQPMIFQRTLTAIFAAYPAGLIFSPFVGGLIANAFGIRACLWIGAALFVVSLVVILFARHVAPIAMEHHEDRPAALFQNRGFRVLAFYYAAAAFVYMLGFPLAPVFFEQVHGFSFSAVGLLFSLMSVGTVVFNLLSGRISRRWNFPLILAIIWLAMFGMWQAGSLAIPLPPIGGSPPPAALVPAMASFFALGAVWAARTLALSGISTVVRPRNRTLAFSVVDTLTAVATALAARLAGEMFADLPSLPFIASMIGLTVMIGAWFLVGLKFTVVSSLVSGDSSTR